MTKEKKNNSQEEVEEIILAEKGKKLDHLKKLQSTKKHKKKCKCGCEMVIEKKSGGKLIETCACHCGGGKVKSKARGGILDDFEIESLVDYGVIDTSIANRWERKLHSNKLGKFKK